MRNVLLFRIADGRRPASPYGSYGSETTGSWHVWDHLIQNFDAEAENYGDPAEHPERIDINGDGPPLEIDAEQLEELKALGYIPDVEENEGDEDADGDEDEDEPRPRLPPYQRRRLATRSSIRSR